MKPLWTNGENLELITAPGIADTSDGVDSTGLHPIPDIAETDRHARA